MRNQKVQLAVGIAISVFFLYLTMRPINMSDLWTALLSFRWLYAIPFLAVTFLSMYIRAIRWHFLMRPTAILSPQRLFSPMMVGFGLNSLLPARAGEFARAYVLSAREKLPFTSVFATIVVERIFDMLTLLFLLAVVFASLNFDPRASKIYSTESSLSASQVILMVNIVAGVILVLALSISLILRDSVRRYLISHFERKPSANRGSAAVALRVLRLIERMGAPAWMDGIWLLLLFIIAVAMWWAHSPHYGPPQVWHFGRKYAITGAMLRKASVQITVASLIALGGSFLLLWEPARQFIQNMVERFPFGPRGLRMKVSGMVHSFSHGLSSLRDIRASIMVFLLSLAVWVTVGWSLQIMAYGFTNMKMTLPEGVALTVIAAIAILIPAAPGYWGLMEVGIVFGMVVLNIEPNEGRALAYSLSMHAIQIIPIIAVGLFCLWRERISLSEIQERRQVH